jgi:hypothetical protein
MDVPVEYFMNFRLRARADTDVTALLQDVRMPSLVLHAREPPDAPVRQAGRLVARAGDCFRARAGFVL